MTIRINRGFLFLATMIALCGCSAANIAKGRSDDILEIKLAVYSDMQDLAPGGGSQIVFVKESPEVISRLGKLVKDRGVEVHAMEDRFWTTVPISRASGRPGVELWITNVSFDSDLAAQCFAEFMYGNVGGQALSYHLRRINGVWQVSRIEVIRIY